MLKVIGKFFLILLVGILVILSATPYFLSTDWGKSLFFNALNRNLSGHFEADSLSLSWLGDQKVKNLRLIGKDEAQILSVKSLESEKSLLSWVFSPHKTKNIRLVDLNLALIPDSAGTTNIEDALGIKEQIKSALNTPVYFENGNIELREISPRNFTLKAVGLTRQNDIKGQFSLDAQTGDETTINLKASHFPTLALDQVISIQDPSLSGFLVNALGNFIDATVENSVNGKENTISLIANTPFIEVQVKGKVNGNQIAVRPGGLIKFAIPTEQLELIRKNNIKALPRALKPLTGELALDALEIPLDRKNQDSLFGKLRAHIGPNLFIFDDDQSPVNLSQLSIAIDAPRNSKNVALEVSSTGENLGQPVALNFEFRLPKSTFYSENIEMQFEKGVSFQGSFGGHLTSLPTSVGPYLSIKWTGVLKETNSELKVAFESTRVSIPEFLLTIPSLPLKELLKGKPLPSSIEGVAKIKSPQVKEDNRNLLSKIDEITIPWKFDPEGDSIKVQFSADSCAKPCLKGSLWIDDLHQEAGIDFSKATIKFQLKMDAFDTQILQAFVPDVTLYPIIGDTLNSEVTVNRDANGNVNGEFELLAPKNSEGFIKKVSSRFSLQNNNKDITFEANSHQTIGSTHLEGTLHHLFNDEGALTIDESYISIQGNLKHLPVHISTLLATQDEKLAGKMEAILGNHVDATLYGEIRKKTGPLKVTVKGSNGEFYIDGRLDAGILLLNEPLTAKVKVSPQLESTVLRETLPILGSLISAEKPIELTVPTAGFSLPLAPLNLQALAFSHAKLELNKVIFNNDSQIGKAVALLGVNSKTFEVWFTPIYFSLNNAVLDMWRTDMLIAGKYPLASWGSIDFNQDYLNLVIGLSSQALRNAYAIKGLKEGQMIQIPLRGPIKKPQLDTGKIAPRLTALAAQSQGSPEGKIIGTFLEVASDLMNNDKTPPPTTNPLPWEGEVEETDSNDQDFKPEPLEKLQQGLQKGAKKLMKGLFG